MEQMGLILDKMKFHTWGPIYVIDCWPLEVDLKETNNFLFFCLPCVIAMGITDRSKHIEK